MTENRPTYDASQPPKRELRLIPSDNRRAAMPKRGGTPAVTFRLGDVEPLVRARIGVGLAQTLASVARRDLDRYYGLLRAGRQEVRGAAFSANALLLLADGVRGRLVETSDAIRHGQDGAPFLVAAIEDADLAEKWGVEDREQLVGQIAGLSRLGVTALIDHLERFWTEEEGHYPVLQELMLPQPKP